MTVSELYEQIEGDYEAAKRVIMTDPMIARFIVRILDDPTYGKLEAAGESMDPAALFEAAHALKGMTASLGLTKLSSLSSEITEDYRPGKERHMTNGQVKEKLESIRDLYGKTLEGVRAFAEQ